MSLEKEILDELKKINSQLSILLSLQRDGHNQPDGLLQNNELKTKNSTNIYKNIGTGDTGNQIKELIEKARIDAERRMQNMIKNTPHFPE